MSANQKRDEALSGVLRASMTFLDSEPQVAVHDLPDRARVGFIQTGDQLETAAHTYARAMQLRESGDSGAGPMAYEAYRQLRQAAITTLITIGHFPWYEDVPEAAPGEPATH